MCAACNRPLAPHEATCVYCGETLLLSVGRRILRTSVATVALAGTAALIVARWPILPEAPSAFPNSLIAALGAGLALAPPDAPGVAAATPGERLRQAPARAAGGWLLTALTAGSVIAAVAPQPWTPATLALAIPAGLALCAAPVLFGLPRHNLLAGLLLGFGLTSVR